MHSETERLALEGILENIALARTFVEGMTFAQFEGDRRTVYAVTRCLEIISEASRRLGPELKGRHPDINWVKVAASGNIYRHGYRVIRDQILWDTVEGSLTLLGQVVETELNRAKAS